jgi:hypothetical protein
LLTIVAGHTRAQIDALASVRILNLSRGAGDGHADAGAAVEIELLARLALIADTLLTATDLAGAAGRPVRLPLTWIAGAGVRIGRLAVAEINALVLAADLPVAAFHLTARSVEARFARAAGMFAAPTVLAVVLQVDALPVAHRAILATAALAKVTFLRGCTSMAARAAVLWIETQVGALLVTAGLAAGATILAALVSRDLKIGIAGSVATETAAGQAGTAYPGSTDGRATGRITVHQVPQRRGPAAPWITAAGGSGTGRIGGGRPPNQGQPKPAQQPFEYLST